MTPGGDHENPKPDCPGSEDAQIPEKGRQEQEDLHPGDQAPEEKWRIWEFRRFFWSD